MPTRSSTQKRRRSSSGRKPSANKWVRNALRYRNNQWTEKKLLKKTGSLIARLLVLNQILDEWYEKPLLTDSTVEELKEALPPLQEVRQDNPRTGELLSDL